MLERTKAQSPFYTADHEAFRDVMRRFVTREIEPYAHEWDEAGEFPRALYAKASEIGLLGLGFPEEYGGVPADQFMKIVASQELARAEIRRPRPIHGHRARSHASQSAASRRETLRDPRCKTGCSPLSAPACCPPDGITMP